MKLTALILSITFPGLLLSQITHDGLEFSNTNFLFPKAENWINKIDTIEVTNTSDKTIHLLRLDDPRFFEIRFPQKPIEPGKTEIIEIIFTPKEKGPFNFTFPFYHSASLAPIQINYSGNIKSFDEFSKQACPSFKNPNLKPALFEMEVLVIDSVTKKSLSYSALEIAKGEYFQKIKTDTNGIFRQNTGVNFYTITADHAGYQTKSISRIFNPKKNKTTIALVSFNEITPTDSSIITPPEIQNIPTTTFELSKYKKNNIVFLIDKSSSMNKPDCMPYLQTAMMELAKMMRAEDRITIITYANTSKIVLSGTPGNETKKINSVISELKCGGRTEGGKAILTAYQNAEENFIKHGVNQIIIATDGGFNGLSENEGELMNLVAEYVKKDITLSVLAFGENRYGKAHITRLAKQGEGFYLFVANQDAAKNQLNAAIKAISKK